MKKITNALCSIILMLSSFVATAQDYTINSKKYEFEKKKTYEKSYSIVATDKIRIENKFGFVHINVWDKAEIKMTVEIEVSSNKEEWANEILNKIEIIDKKTSGNVSFITKLDGGNNYGNNRKNMSNNMQINMTVYLPANNPLVLKNEFGPITMPDFNGLLDVESKFGSLTAGKLTNIESINIEFGKANLKSLTNADAVFKFSKIEIDNLIGKNNLKFEFCNSSKVNLTNEITSLNIAESYSTLNLKPTSDFSADYNIKTSFGSLKNRTSIKFQRTDEESKYADNDKEYEGQSGNGACKVKIKSSFGKIILGEPTADEMEDKKEKKRKKESDSDGVEI